MQQQPEMYCFQGRRCIGKLHKEIKKFMKTISLLIPAYNEEKLIEGQ